MSWAITYSFIVHYLKVSLAMFYSSYHQLMGFDEVNFDLEYLNCGVQFLWAHRPSPNFGELSWAGRNSYFP